MMLNWSITMYLTLCWEEPPKTQLGSNMTRLGPIMNVADDESEIAKVKSEVGS
jgi:hypothetical protein